jgi:predicted permease
MLDFRAYVRESLAAAGLSAGLETKIVTELAQQLEEFYNLQLLEGITESEAWKRMCEQVPSWSQLIADLEAPSSINFLPRKSRLTLLPRLFDAGLRDVAIGLRLISKARGFAAAVVLTVGICLGANTAIFTIVNSALLHVLRYPEPERILLMANQYPKVGGRGIGLVSSTPDYQDRLDHVSAFEQQAMYIGSDHAFEIAGFPERVHGMAATPSLFRLLRVAPILGRTFEEEEGQLGKENRILLSHALWQQLYNGDRGVVGKTIRLSDRPFVVVGVMPPGFSFGGGEQTRFWIPVAFTEQQKSDDARHSNGWYSIGRLKPGATIEQVRDQLRALDAANLARLPNLKKIFIESGFYTSVEPLQDVITRNIRMPLLLLWGGAAFVLLIGSVNLANLARARSHIRIKELSTRLALGASRLRILSQLLIESVLLTMTGAILALVIGFGILSAVKAIGLPGIPLASNITLDATSIFLTIAVTGALGIGIGIVSAWPLYRFDFGLMLHEESRTETPSLRARTIRRTLIVAQIAIAFVLLVGAGLLIASFRNLLAVDPGYRTEGILTAAIGLPPSRYADDQSVRDFTSRALEMIRGLPGVVSAGVTSIMPLGGNYNSGIIMAEGYVPKEGESVASVVRTTVTPGYFETMGTPLVRGRYFDEHDAETRAPVIVIDERLARRFFGETDPIGKRMYRPNPVDLLTPDPGAPVMTVIGVVREAQLRSIESTDNFAGGYYQPYALFAPRGYGFVIRTSVDPAAVLRSLREQLAMMDPALPLADVHTMSERLDISLQSRRSATLMASAFGAVAVLLAGLGIYGVLAYLVSHRTREIGIRIALGSTPTEIFRLVMREGVLLIAVGLALGVAGTIALGRILQAQLYGIQSTNLVIIGLAVFILGVIALAACALPARRATRVDPVSVLSSS